MDDEKTALQIASEEHHDDGAQLILDYYGIDANHLDGGGLTPLIIDKYADKFDAGYLRSWHIKGWGVWVLLVGISGLKASGSASTHDLNSFCSTESQAVVTSVFSSQHCTECVTIPSRISENIYCSGNLRIEFVGRDSALLT